ncbi:hypothetical protein [Actinopolyspora alba]|uniref:hypothetical protein n=1 Tax=Actinopolyspora alba TaxID=673379 RepID=UPI00111466E1|nr:hypothetical protein [Actinopolyspora alba]
MSDVTVGTRIREDDILPRNSIILRAGYVSGFHDLFQIVFSPLRDLRSNFCRIFLSPLLVFSPADSTEMMFPRIVPSAIGEGRWSSACGAKWSFG